MSPKRLIVTVLCSLTLTAATSAALLVSGGAIASATSKTSKAHSVTLKLVHFTNESATVQGDVKPKFQCNTASDTYSLKLTDIDVTYGDGNSFVEGTGDQELYLWIGTGFAGTPVGLPITQNSTNGLWQVGIDGVYAGTLPAGTCSAGTTVIINDNGVSGESEPAGGYPFDFQGTL
jgi:hypothetical protein